MSFRISVNKFRALLVSLLVVLADFSVAKEMYVAGCPKECNDRKIPLSPRWVVEFVPMIMARNMPGTTYRDCPDPNDPLCPPPGRNDGGLCFLTAEDIVMHQCYSKKQQCKPHKPCPDLCQFHNYLELSGSYRIASEAVWNELSCTVSIFRPYHITGVIEPISIKENEKFVDFTPIKRDPKKKYRIVHIVKDFSPYESVEIKGLDWLSIKEGFLYGEPPKKSKYMEYLANISASNSRGTESIDFVIKVYPE